MKENKMGSAPMFPLILSMSLPAMFSMLVQSMYNIVDSMFVARLGEEALTSLSLAFPIQNLMVAVAVGTGVGINSVISRRLGEKRHEEASMAATHGVVIAIASWLVFVVLGVFGTSIFFKSFTDNANVVNMGSTYIYVVTIFSLGIFLQVNIEKTLQATGNMIYPMLLQLIGAITNIILDPILIFGWFGFPKMGVLGAAVATVIGQLLGMLCSLYILLVKKHEIHISFKGFKFSGKTIKEIYAVGFPSIVMQSISSVMIVGLNAILIGFSEAAVSVLGVYYKLQSFVFMPVFGLTQGIMPILGYNYGAKNKDRIVSALKIGSLIAVCIMAAGNLLFLTIPDKLLMIFNASPEMLSIGIPALRTICWCFVPAALGILFSTLFQAIGMGVNSLIVSLARQLGIILPCAYFFSKIGLSNVWYAFPLSEFVALILSMFLLYSVYNNKVRYLTRDDMDLEFDTTEE